MSCCQSIVCNASNFSSVSDQLPSHLKQLSERFLGLIPGRTQILRVVCTNMTCSLKSDGHEIFTVWLRSDREFFILSLGLRPYLCLTIEKTFSVCGTQSVDFSRLCGQMLSLPLVSAFPDATSLLVLFESSGKFRCSWSSSVATSLLVLSSRTASFCHA